MNADWKLPMNLAEIEKAISQVSDNIDGLIASIEMPVTPEAAEAAFIKAALEVDNLWDKLTWAEHRYDKLRVNYLTIRLAQLEVGQKPKVEEPATPVEPTVESGGA